MKRKTNKTDPKWLNEPSDYSEAEKAVKGRPCPLCAARMLISIIRYPLQNWRAHCNHCGSEFLIAVLLNRKAWKESAP
jgi:hypothetical protein